MNTLETRIQSDLMQAMKNKDTVKMTALRDIKKNITEMKTAEANSIKEPTDEDIIRLIQKMAKEMEKPIADFEKNGRVELAKEYKEQVAVFEEYLPKMLSEAEVVEIVDKTIADLGATSMKDMGKVMGFINKEYAGLVKGSMVSAIVKSKLY